jgi:hypothetical protein
VIQNSPPAGTVLKQLMFTAAECGWTGNINTTSSTGTTLASKSFSPITSQSYLHLHFGEIDHLAVGSGVDGFKVRLVIGGSTVGESNIQYFGSYRNWGTTLHTVSGRYTNSSTSPLTISIVALRSGGDDTLQLGASGFLTITEVAR